MGAARCYTRPSLSVRLATRLLRRGRTFHYRRRVPRDLRHLLPREIIRSLATQSLLVARKRARRLDDQVSALFTMARRRPGMTPEELDHLIAELVDAYVVRLVEEDRRGRCREEDPFESAEGLEIGTSEIADSLAEGRVWKAFREEAEQAARRAGVELDDGALSRLAWELARVSLGVGHKLGEERRRDVRGQPRFSLDQFVGQAAAGAGTQPSSPTAPVPSRQPPGPLLSEAVERYLKEAARSWSRRHEVVVRGYMRSLVQHLGAGRPMARLGKADVVAWREKLRETGVAEVTVGKYVKAAAKFFRFAEDAEWISSNPAERLPGGNAARDRRRPDELRQAVSDDDLVCILGRPAFSRLRRGTPKEQELFWATLLLAYSGARREEVAEAWVDDVRDVDAVRCFRIEPSDEPGAEKSVKTAAAGRLIPLHPDLITLGFLDYVTAAHAEGRKRLFPSVARQHGDPLTRAWQRWREDTGADPGATLHGLRHRVATQLKYAGVQEARIAEILGHADRSMSTGRYGKRYDVARLLEAVEQIDNRGPLALLFERG